MLFYFTVCLSSIYTINYFCVVRYYLNIGYIKTRTNVKSSIVPEEGWFGQPKYSIPSKNHPTLCRFLLLYSSVYLEFVSTIMMKSLGRLLVAR